MCTTVMRLSFSLLFVFVLFPKNVVNRERENEKTKIKILGLFGPEEIEEQFVFRKAVEEANKELRRTQWELEEEIIELRIYDNFHLSKVLCDKLSEGDGYGAVFGPDYADLTNTVKSITETKTIPHIDTRWDTSYGRTSDIYINLFPKSTYFAKAISDVLESMNWETFTLVYESCESLINLQDVLKEKLGPSKYDRATVIMKQLPENVEDYKPFLKEIKNSSETHIMIHCSPDYITSILEKTQEVDLMGPYQHFFLTSLDAHTINYTRFRTNVSSTIHSQANITTFRLINTASQEMRNYIQKLNKDLDPNRQVDITASTMKTDTALMRDAVLFFTEALRDMPKNFTTNPVDCFNPADTWQFGPKIVKKMKSIEFKGLSGQMEYDGEGKRKYFRLEVVEINDEGYRSLGSWDPTHVFTFYRNLSQIQQESSSSIVNKTLRVVSKLGPPYLRESNNGSGIGNDQYEGFCKDLLDALAELLKFNYVLNVPANIEVGELNQETGRYSGLIGELREFRADMAICDFTITPERKKAVDFTAPFMSLGISILYTEAPARATSLFSFLKPYHTTVWIYVITAYLSLSLILYIIARSSPDEWESSHPCDEDPEELENVWTLTNCLWLGMGSLLCAGCDIMPKSISTRLLTGMWWFFTLIITSTYTANLAAFLTTQRMESSIKSVEDLANQDEVKYGCLVKGATLDFFKTSNDNLYQRMYATMESENPSVFCETNDKGVQRVLRSGHKYAFFMESSSIEYQINSQCGLMQIGNPLDSKFYGIAVPKGSGYLDVLTTGILTLKEGGVLDQLKEKWWKDKIDKKTCEEGLDVDEEDKDKLDLANVGGVFVLLICGCSLALFISVLEFFWLVRKVAVKEKISLAEAFRLELQFIIKFHQATKPVRHIRESSNVGTLYNVSRTDTN